MRLLDPPLACLVQWRDVGAVLALGLAACAGKPHDSVPGGHGGLDVDEDGFAAADDCDDANAAVHPRATETCNGIDDDCDGTIDTGAADGTAYFPDRDGDGFGAGDVVILCEQEDGFVVEGGDCDEARTDVHPGAIEVCDDLGTDEDCDGLVDDQDTLDPSTGIVMYADVDGDTHGDPSGPIVTCTPREGYVSSADDCDDTTDLVRPDTPEVCRDRLDNDCDPSTSDCGWVGALGSDVATVTLRGGAGDHLGNQVAFGGDVNGDGVGDLVVGSASAPAAYLFSGPVSSTTADEASGIFSTTEFSDVDIQGVGDWNGDAYDDLVVLGRTFDATKGESIGTSYVVPGPVAGESAVADLAVATITGEWGDDLSGVPATGDLNGDATLDLALSAPYRNDWAGAVYVYSGPVTGELTAADAVARIEGVSEWESVGRTLEADGDIDGDGVGDLLVGASGTGDPGAWDGVAWLFYGPVSGEQRADDGDVLVSGSDSLSLLGWRGSINGDLDGDGLEDLAIPDRDDGSVAPTVYVLYANRFAGNDALDVSDADATLTGDWGVKGSDLFGYSLDMGGDLDDDGHDDLAVGNPFPGWPSGYLEGATLVFFGPVSGAIDESDAPLKIYGLDGGTLGIATAFVGDVTADGTDDLAIGDPMAPEPSTGDENAGAVYLLDGAATP